MNLFCFDQQRFEWVRLKESHSDLYEKATDYERPYEDSSNTFTWSERGSLLELERPERMTAIEEKHDRRRKARKRSGTDPALAEVYAEGDEPI